MKFKRFNRFFPFKITAAREQDMTVLAETKLSPALGSSRKKKDKKALGAQGVNQPRFSSSIIWACPGGVGR